jgi:plasmid stabilization system protein ParE
LSGSRQVIISPTAGRHIKDAAAWWAEKRPAAPDVFKDELNQALNLIAAHPSVGMRAANVKLSGVRRILLGRARYHIFYRLSSDGKTVGILALWNSRRGSAPPI